MALCGLYDQVMMNLKRYWTGPRDESAWQFSGLQRDLYIRTWPVKFKNRENFEAFFNGVADDRAVQEAHDAWTLYVNDHPEEQVPAVISRLTVTSPHYKNRQFETVDEFLRGLDPRAMREIIINQSIQYPSKHKGMYLSLRGFEPKKVDRRGRRAFVSLTWIGGTPEGDEFPAFLPPVLSLLDQYTVPMTLLDRVLQRPVVSRFSVKEIDEKRGSSKNFRWSAAISAGTSLLTIWLTSLGGQ